MIPAITTTKNRMTLPPSSSSVSIRFWISTAESSWAVPSVASRSSSVLKMPWMTTAVESRKAISATMTMTRIRMPADAEGVEDRAQRRLFEVHRARW